jgi:uncharacterized protein
MNKKILITGGSGIIGSALTRTLLNEGYEVAHLSRTVRPLPGVSVYRWNIDEGYLDPGALRGTEAIVHLAGAGVADKPWTDFRKKELYASRVESASLLHKALADHPHQVKTLVSASGSGIYGADTGDALMEEDAPVPGDDFLARLCAAWEASVGPITELGIRTVILRIGPVLSRSGGFLEKMSAPVRLGAGAALGSGLQYISWIHLDDLLAMMLFAIRNPAMEGVCNAVAPQPVSNLEMTRAIARALHRPLLLPRVPAFALRLVLGEMASMVLGGNRLSARRALGAGFRFRFEDIDSALQDIYGKKAG